MHNDGEGTLCKASELAQTARAASYQLAHAGVMAAADNPELVGRTTVAWGRLEGKRVLVTGGTSGIGYAIADRFLREGAAVVITGRDQELGLRAEAALRASGQAGFVPADAGDPDAVARSVDLAAGQLGGLDVLVNNAGIGTEASLLDTPLAD